MNIPADLKYTHDNEWIRVEGDEAYIGITDFAQSQLGDVVFVEIMETGRKIEQSESFGTVESVKTVSELFMPVSGTILEANSELENEPELLNTDPYGDGWIIKIRLADASSVNSLLSPKAYEELIKDE
jgi:glycine cleavage system H protein